MKTISDYSEFGVYSDIERELYRVARKSSKNIQRVIDKKCRMLICTK